MSKYQQVGRSFHTNSKQSHFEYFLRTHFCISKAIIKRNHWINNEYFYADIFAGDGGEETLAGSPVIFDNVNREHDITKNPIFIESNPGTVIRLEDHIPYKVICDRNENVLPHLPLKKNMVGLMYVDPNGDPPFDLIRQFYQRPGSEMVDLLVYFSGTTIKRALKSPIAKRNLCLKDNISNLPKKHWLIRGAKGKFQWSFLMGTNWIDFPKMNKIDFHKIDSDEGQYTLNKLNHTAQEIEQLNIKKPFKQVQMSLFKEARYA